MQHEDSVLSTIIQKIDQNDVTPQVSNYFINGEGLLCHLSKHPSRSPRSNTTRKQVCIPHCLKARILESVHSEYGGHLKFFKAYHRLSENFFWQNMYKDTKNFVRSCTVCLSRKNAFKIPQAPHQPVEQSQEPGGTCHIDIFGPLKTTPKDDLQPDETEVKGIVPSSRKRISKEFGGASGSTDLMAGKVMFLRSNQGGRLDGNESVADSFRSDLVGFKSWSRRIIGAFSPSYVCQKSLPVGKRTGYPRSPLRSSQTDK
ncbi:integrase_H2C2 domain-containing protein [Trichonephila clavipes]|nr:integrase_H2C2 domain-containing protein [Trichonephila clavipes]